MFSTDRQQILGALKSTASRDPDILAARKGELMQDHKKMRIVSLYLIIFGSLLTVTIIFSFLGLPILGGGIWLRLRAGKNMRLIDTVFQEYAGSVGAV